MEDLSCCCHQVLNSELLFTVNSHLSVSNVEVEEINDSFYFPASTSDEQTSESFEEDTILVSCDLAEVYEQLTENESSLAMPCDEDIKKIEGIHFIFEIHRSAYNIREAKEHCY